MEETTEEERVQPTHQLKRHRAKRLAELDECQQMLDVLKQNTRSSHGYCEVRSALQLYVLSTLKRKHQDDRLNGPAEVAMFEQLLVSYDPGRRIACSGPCGRLLKRSRFGAIQVKRFGWQWPPCLECCGNKSKE